MEEKVDDSKDYCLGCLCDKNMRRLNYYTFLCGPIRDIFKTDSIILCYLCRRIAQQSENLIQNVKSNQILLENFNNICDGYVMDETLKSARLRIQPLINLEQVTYKVMETSAVDGDNTEVTSTVLPNNLLVEIEVKQETNMEVKEEGNLLDHTLRDVINSNNDSRGTFKDEDEFPLDQMIKDEFGNENSDGLENNDYSDVLMLQHNIQRRRKIRKDKDSQATFVKDEDGFPLDQILNEEFGNETSDGLENNDDSDFLMLQYNSQRLRRKIKKQARIKDVPRVKMIYLTRKQCLEERLEMVEDQKYLNSVHKCTDCIKGFICKTTFNLHMEKHNQSNGDYECDVCRQRTDTKEKLANHMRIHHIRYQCMECGLIRNGKESIRDHYTSNHLENTRQHHCTHCVKTFKQGSSLRRHISLVHRPKERLQCAYCNRTYGSKYSLRTHMLLKHNKEISAEEVTKKCVCPVCGVAFKTPSQLKYHSIKHSDTRDYYCVECDKSFKSEYILKNHLKTASIHVNYKDLPLSCSHCDKRFSTRRDVTRHTNRIHLKIRPYECDKCDKAYVNIWSLNEHKKSTHEGYKRPLRYPCTMCDKVFHRSQILKSHIRVHTGERPYQCPKCPANFSQASILRTHDRLIHLKLTRSGKSKPPRNKE